MTKYLLNKAKSAIGLFAIIACVATRVAAQNNDLFTFAENTRNEDGVLVRGQKEWDEVRCGNVDTCTGYPNKFPAVQLNSSYYEWDIDDEANNCRWCPEDSEQRNCGWHRQSPVDLRRYVGEHTEQWHQECRDWHWMQYKDDTCSFDDMKDHFEISRHALQIYIPVRDDGKIDCWLQGKGRRFPRLDYSKGFPDWWWLQRTDIAVPSHHTQEGFRYAAEVTLAHFYQIPHTRNQLGYVTLLMQDYPDEPSWPFLDKLICQWREKEEKIRSACGEDPAPPYGRCRIFSERGQQPTQEWLQDAGLLTDPPTASPTTLSPTAGPSESPSKAPTASPSVSPSTKPTVQPSRSPSASPTRSPTSTPTKGSDNVDEDEFEENDGESQPNPAPSRFRPSRFRPSVPIAHTPQPTETAFGQDGGNSPTSAPIDRSKEGIPGPPEINCANYEVPGGYGQMCVSATSCCEDERAGTDYCWNIYEKIFPGPSIESACYHCCPTIKEIGPPAEKEKHPEGYEKTIQCSDFSPQRYCKPYSCCERGRSSSRYCRQEFRKFQPQEWEELCWYCCLESFNIESGLEDDRRTLLEISFDEDVVGPVETEYLFAHEMDDDEQDAEDIDDEYVVMHAEGRMFRLHKQDLQPAEEDPEDYFYRIYHDFKQRQRRTQSEVIHEENYEDVHYWPYEWMLHVGTEYYFRYEGTQPVPPCRDQVHWRVMKDPMRVHPRQIMELNRLLAWRLDPGSCQKETAGVLSNDGDTVDVSRDIQYHTNGHRDVFCECKDWPSKFENDKEWCRDWKDDANFDRFYWRPYSFDTGGQWLPPPPGWDGGST